MLGQGVALTFLGIDPSTCSSSRSTGKSNDLIFLFFAGEETNSDPSFLKASNLIWTKMKPKKNPKRITFHYTQAWNIILQFLHHFPYPWPIPTFTSSQNFSYPPIPCDGPYKVNWTSLSVRNLLDKALILSTDKNSIALLVLCSPKLQDTESGVP